jgi:predicted dehydrogenase
LQAKAGPWLVSAEEGGGPVREVGSHFVWLAVRAQGGGEADWRVTRRESERDAAGLERRLTARAEGPNGAAIALDFAVGEAGVAEDAVNVELRWGDSRRAGLRDWMRVEGAPQPPHEDDAEARALARLLDAQDPTALPTVAEALCVARIVEDMLAVE